MTQDQFYKEYDVAIFSKEQRLIKDLRESDFSWDQIATVMRAMIWTPSDWNIQFDTYTPDQQQWLGKD